MQTAHRARKLWWRIRKPQTLGVKAVVRNEQGHILLVKPVYATVWQLPGGGVHRMEHPVVAVSREVLEETGIRVDPDRFRLAEVLLSTHEGKSDTVIVYHATVIDEMPTPDGREIGQAAFFAIDDLPDDSAGSILRRAQETGAHRFW